MCKVGEELRIKTSLSVHSRQAFLGGSQSKTPLSTHSRQEKKKERWGMDVQSRRRIKN